MDELDSIFSDDWGADHRSGIVAVVGRPNVGKSTLINALLGQKVAITAAKPQTTRRRQLGILTTDQAQLLFVDTPGVHIPQSQLGKYMMSVARAALRDADAVLWIVDASNTPSEEELHIADLIANLVSDSPIILVLNKADLLDADDRHGPYLKLGDFEAFLYTSATEGRGIDEILSQLVPLMPFGPRYFPKEQISDANMRLIGAETIREKIIELTSEEIPHAIAVEINRFRERRDLTVIEATIYVERASQKGIVIGKRGRMIRQIGVEARSELERLLDKKVHLETRVKVLKNWRSNDDFLRRVGYALPRRKGR